MVVQKKKSKFILTVKKNKTKEDKKFKKEKILTKNDKKSIQAPLVQAEIVESVQLKETERTEGNIYKITLEESGIEQTVPTVEQPNVARETHKPTVEEKLNSINDVRNKQDKMVDHIEEGVFKQRINLTSLKKRNPGEFIDENLRIQQESKKYWELTKNKRRSPPKGQEMKFKQTRGNLKMPDDLKKRLY